MNPALTRRATLGAFASIPLMSSARLLAESYSPVRVLEAAKIVTMEPGQPNCRFVAVAGGLILATGNSLDELAPWTRGREVQLDRRFAGKTLLPGLIDPHVHPMQGAIMLNIPFIAPDDWMLPDGASPGARSPADYRARLAAALGASRADPFITWGYHELFHGALSRADLDAMAPGRAVVVWQRSFHEIIVSSAMLARWGITDQAGFDAMLAAVHADFGHGNFARGLFSETAMLAAIARLRPVLLGPGLVERGMGKLQTMMRRSGVTTISDMGTGIFAGFEIESTLIRAAFERSDSASRIMLMPLAQEFMGEADLGSWLARTKAKWESPRVRVDRRVKMLADGAFFALNMRMNAPGYIDGHQGKWITEPAALRAQFAKFWDAGFSLHIHVNGDEGLDTVLDGLGALAPARGQTITLEHLGYSTEAQNRRIARMGLMVSAQPNYIRVLGDAYEREGLGPGRAALIDRLGSLERKGVPLGLHSDFNMAPIDPLYLAWIAANRVTIEGHVKAPEERLSLDKALRAVTIEAAQVIGWDAEIGSIAPGKKADFTVLDKDPYALGAARLREARIEGVVFEGTFSPA